LKLAYNFNKLIKPAAISSLLLFLCTMAAPSCIRAQQSEATRQSHMLLIMPFENGSAAPGIDWIGEAFPEVLGLRMDSGSLFVISRNDRVAAFDRLGIPASAKPSRATVYQIAQELEADYVLMGNYSFDGQTFTARARIMDTNRLRLGSQLIESGPLNNLIKIQTALAWDVLDQLKVPGTAEKSEFVAKFGPMRLDALENYVRGVLAGSPQEKIKRFQETVRLEPAHTLAMLQLGKTYYGIRNYEQTINWLSKIPRNDPSSNEARFYLGLAAFYSNQMDKADAAFREVATHLPLTEVVNNLGVVAARRGDRQARGYFEKSVETDPNDPDYHFNLAVELYREGDAAGASRELRSTLSLHTDPEARSFLDAIASGATSLPRLPLERIKRNYDESSFRQLAVELENADEARLAQTDPVKHAAFHVQRGQEFLKDGLTSQAEKQFREAVILDPTNAGAHAGLAEVLESNQDPNGARNEAHASLRLKASPEAYLVLARLDLAQNNASDAERNVEQALALDPANAAAIEFKRDLTARTAAKPK
jgi:Tfp pilus assembly protein PilF/TolB-like protein